MINKLFLSFTGLIKKVLDIIKKISDKKKLMISKRFFKACLDFVKKFSDKKVLLKIFS